MKIKTADLIDDPLDWAVQHALGWVAYPLHHYDDWLRPEAIARFEQSGHFACMVKNDEIKQGVAPYSTEGSEVIDIMEREGISARPVFHAERTESGSDIYRQEGWAAHTEPKAFWITPRPVAGPTPASPCAGPSSPRNSGMKSKCRMNS